MYPTVDRFSTSTSLINTFSSSTNSFVWYSSSSSSSNSPREMITQREVEENHPPHPSPSLRRKRDHHANTVHYIWYCTVVHYSHSKGSLVHYVQCLFALNISNSLCAERAYIDRTTGPGGRRTWTALRYMVNHDKMSVALDCTGWDQRGYWKQDEKICVCFVPVFKPYTVGKEFIKFWFRPIKTQDPSPVLNRLQPGIEIQCALCRWINSQSQFDKFHAHSVCQGLILNSC